VPALTAGRGHRPAQGCWPDLGNLAGTPGGPRRGRLVDYDDAARVRTGDVDANLWSGIVMIVVAVVFALWLRLRPVVVDPVALEKNKGEGTSEGSEVPSH
jgi:hypothetical protein